MPPELRALHAWLDTWHGIGLITQGLARQDRDLSLTRYRDRWGAICQPVPDAVGAVQQAAFQALHRGRNWRADPWAL